MTATLSPLLRGEGLPQYSAINPETVSRDVPALLKALNDEFSALEQSLDQALSSDAPLPWDAVMIPMQRIGERLRWSWGVVSHLNGVCNSKDLREAHAAQQPEVVRLGNRLGQSQVLHRALQRLRDLPAEPLSETRNSTVPSPPNRRPRTCAASWR